MKKFAFILFLLLFIVVLISAQEDYVCIDNQNFAVNAIPIQISLT